MMKFQVPFLLVAMAFALALAEPPRRRSRPLWGARLQEEAPPAPPAEAPYPPSGWKPDKPFYLPGEYGGPEEGTTPEEEETATTTPFAPEEEETATTTPFAPEEEETTTTTTAAPEDDGAEARDSDDYDQVEPEPAPANIPAGVYYVLLPDGRLQRVNYQVAAPAGPVSGSYVLQEAVAQPVPYSSPIFAYQPPSFVQILKK